MNSKNADLVKKYRSRSLTLDEQRAFARLSLTDEDLFDELALNGVLEERLQNAAFRKKWLSPASNRLPYLKFIAIAAGLMLTGFMVFALKHFRFGKELTPSVAVGLTTTRSKLIPTPALEGSANPALEGSANPDQPILVATRLTSRFRAGQVFRGLDETDGNSHKAGAVIGMTGDDVTIDLGFEDGVALGTILPVFRDGTRIAQLRVAIGFEKECRGEIVQGGPIQIGDSVILGIGSRLSALWAKADDLSNAKKDVEALGLTKRALDIVQRMRARPQLESEALERLAVLEYRTGNWEASLGHYHTLLERPDGAKRQSAWEAYGVVNLLMSRQAEAKRALMEAKSRAGKDQSALCRAWNNLAVLAEVTGDRSLAMEYLQKTTKDDRTLPAARKNLDRLREDK